MDNGHEDEDIEKKQYQVAQMMKKAEHQRRRTLRMLAHVVIPIVALAFMIIYWIIGIKMYNVSYHDEFDVDFGI